MASSQPASDPESNSYTVASLDVIRTCLARGHPDEALTFANEILTDSSDAIIQINAALIIANSIDVHRLSQESAFRIAVGLWIQLRNRSNGQNQEEDGEMELHVKTLHDVIVMLAEVHGFALERGWDDGEEAELGEITSLLDELQL